MAFKDSPAIGARSDPRTLLKIEVRCKLRSPAASYGSLSSSFSGAFLVTGHRAAVLDELDLRALDAAESAYERKLCLT
jgi:hypothetical protein